MDDITSSLPPLSREFGRNLYTLADARVWLTHPANWHSSHLYILRWDGPYVTVMREHGERLLRETWDDGLPWVVVVEQERRRRWVAGGSGTLEPIPFPDEVESAEEGS